MQFIETRKVDEVGRVSIPKALLEQLQVQKDADSLDFYVHEGTIVLKPSVSKCTFCKSETSQQFRGNFVCPSCKSELAKQ